MSRIRPVKFVHVVYRTRRFQEMIRWYENVFDAKVQYQSPVLAFMTYDDEHHRFAFINLEVIQPDGSQHDRQGSIGVDHVAYTYRSLTELFDNYVQLKEQGILPYWCVHHGITVSMYYGDPDGNQMEFQVDSYPSNDQANEFMYGPGFDTNPIGVEYDPEDWLAQMEAGASGTDFLLCKVHLPVSPIRGAAST